MRKLNAKETAWLKVLHLICVGAWIGGQMSFLIVQNLKYQLAPPTHQYAVIATLKAIDDVVIVGGAIGCLLTGLLYSLLTPWGFFRFRWITVKWVATVVLILFGTFFLGPWIDEMALISSREYASALLNPVFLHDEKMNMTWGTIQFGINICLIVISVLKPWKRRSGQKGSVAK